MNNTLLTYLVFIPLFASGADWQANPKNINDIIEKARAGDTVYLASGRYADSIELENLKGTAEEPVTIMPAPGASVVFDGTDELSNDWKKVTPNSGEGRLIQPAQWERMQGSG